MFSVIVSKHGKWFRNFIYSQDCTNKSATCYMWCWGGKGVFGEWIAFAPANINAGCASKGPILASWGKAVYNLSRAFQTWNKLPWLRELFYSAVELRGSRNKAFMTSCFRLSEIYWLHDCKWFLSQKPFLLVSFPQQNKKLVEWQKGWSMGNVQQSKLP